MPDSPCENPFQQIYWQNATIQIKYGYGYALSIYQNTSSCRLFSTYNYKLLNAKQTKYSQYKPATHNFN